MHLDETPRQRQPDAQASGRSFENRFRLLEHVEHPWEDVRCDPHPGIADAHDGLIGLLLSGKPDASATRRELHGVVESVREDLDQTRTIAIDIARRHG